MSETSSNQSTEAAQPAAEQHSTDAGGGSTLDQDAATIRTFADAFTDRISGHSRPAGRGTWTSDRVHDLLNGRGDATHNRTLRQAFILSPNRPQDMETFAALTDWATVLKDETTAELGFTDAQKALIDDRFENVSLALGPTPQSSPESGYEST